MPQVLAPAYPPNAPYSQGPSSRGSQVADTIPQFDHSAKDLLRKTLEDPFGGPGSHVEEWYYALMEQCPLLSFRETAYPKLHKGEAPSSYPLGLFVGSICADEGISDQELDPLSALLDWRRHGLADGWPELGLMFSLTDRHHLAKVPRGKSVFRVHPLYMPRYAPDLPEDFQPHDALSLLERFDPYAAIGERFMRLRDERFAARSQDDDTAFQGRLNKLLDDLGLKGRRPGGEISDAAAKILDAEAQALIGLFWALPVPDPSEPTLKLLRDENITHSEGQHLWAARLAIPVLSAKEVAGLIRFRTSLEGKTNQELKAGPRKFSIFLLYRRLRMKWNTFTRKVTGMEAFERTRTYLEDHGNPIDSEPT